MSEFAGIGLIRNDGTIRDTNKGPQIVVEHDAPKSRAGRAPGWMGAENEIRISEWLVEMLNSSDSSIREKAFLIFVETLLHETANRVKTTDYNLYGGEGNLFEVEAFGHAPSARIGDNNMTYWDWWNENVDPYSAEYSGPPPR